MFGLTATRLPGSTRAPESGQRPIPPVTICPSKTIELLAVPGASLKRTEAGSLKSGVKVDTKSELTLTVDPVPKIKPLGLTIQTAPLVAPYWLPLKVPDSAPLIWLIPPPVKLMSKDPRGWSMTSRAAAPIEKDSQLMTALLPV